MSLEILLNVPSSHPHSMMHGITIGIMLYKTASSVAIGQGTDLK